MSAVARSALAGRLGSALPRFGTTRWAALPLAVLIGALLALPEDGILGIDRGAMTSILLVLAFTYAWHPVGGILGQLSLAHLVFWVAGSYAFILATNAGWRLAPTLLAAAAVGAALALVVVSFSSIARLDGLYLMTFGLVLVFLAAAIIGEWDWLGGDSGLSATNLTLSVDTVYTAVVLFCAALIAVNIALLTSRRGLVWLAIRDDEERVAATGWSPRAEQTKAYVGTGALCAIGGALLAASIGYISPETGLELELIVVPILAVFVGGPGTVWGPLFGVTLFEGLSTLASQSATTVESAQNATLVQYLVALVVVALLLNRERGRRGTIAADGEPATSAPTGGPSRAISPPGTGQAEGPLRVESVAKAFGGLHVLSDVTIRVEPGEIVGLVGPNGAGKSTICNIVAGVIGPDSGLVALGSRRVDGLPPYRRARLGLGRTFQTPRVFPTLNLAENVAIAGRGPLTADPAALLRELGVAAPDRNGARASLFERRMVEVARLAATRPRWVLLDEPLAGLTGDEHDVILRLVRRFADAGACVVIIEHLIPAIAPVTDRMIVLSGGRLIGDGEPRAVLRQPEVVDAYLGQPVALEREPAP